jgi:hypothetical protein
MLTSAYPFFATDAGPLRWSDATYLNALHRALWVEVAPRGIRFVERETSRDPSEDLRGTPCLVRTHGALCQTANATLFVSSEFSAHPVQVPWMASASHDAVARAYIDQTHDACAEHGEGRLLLWSGADNNNNNASSMPPRMTVTACDVMDGQLVALWDVGVGRMRLTGQTFGPMAYGVMLLQAAACLYVTTLPKTPSGASAVVVGLVGGCVAAAAHGIQFVTVNDARFFWCIGAWALCLAICGWCVDDAAQRREACLHALSMMACAVHRTPENAYAGLLALVLAVRFWDKVLRWERWLSMTMMQGDENVKLEKREEEEPENEDMPTGVCALVHAVDCLLSAPILLGGARVGLAPLFQSASDARWPLFAGTGLYMCFVFALYRRRGEAL